MIIFEGEELEPGRTARVDQTIAATDDDLRLLVNSFRESIECAKGNEYYALSLETAACCRAMEDDGISHEQIGNYPLLIARAVMLLAKHGVLDVER